MDCGNKDITVETNRRLLEIIYNECINRISKNTTVGSNVSLRGHSKVENSTVKNSIIPTYTNIKNAILDNVMIANNVFLDVNFISINIGDYSILS